MSYETTFLQLPCGARTCRMEFSGVLSSEDVRTILPQLGPGGALHGVPRMFVMQRLGSIPSDARGFIGQSGPAKAETWEAVVVTNPVIRVTVNFFLRVQGRKKTKLFSGEPEALQWLDARVREEASGSPPVDGDPGGEGKGSLR